MPDNKVLRGGSWISDPWLCRSACRSNDLPDYRSNRVGFRVCCLPQDSSGLMDSSDSIPDRDHQHGGFDEPTGEARKSVESASKPRLELLPSAALEQIAQVLTFGAAKYAANNWCRGARWGRYYAALLRHLFAWWRGEDRDPETGLSHLAHAGCCLLFLMEYQRNGWGADDRFRGPDAEAFRKDDGDQP